MARRKQADILTQLMNKKFRKAGGGLLVLVILVLALLAKLAGISLDSQSGNADNSQEQVSAETSEQTSEPSIVLAKQTAKQSSQSAVIPEGEYEVEKCVDGDTLTLKNKVKIRLIGANTPETVKPNSPVEPWGPEASQFTKKVVAANNNRVRITYDGTPTDKYGRTLAMVWVGNTLLNEVLIRNGLARAELQYNYSKEMKARFQAAENDAKRKRLGIWSE